MKKAWAFLKRNLLIASSYKLNFALMLVGGLMTLTVLFFLSRTMGEVPMLKEKYGTGYFAFSLVGVSAAAALRAFQTSFALRLREAQTDGSLETLFSTPLSTIEVTAGLAVHPLLQSLVWAVSTLAAGRFLFGAKLAIDPISFAVTLLLAALPFAALGLTSAAFVLVFKRGDPFAYLIDVSSYLLSGILYPVSVLPSALRTAARFLPATHAVEGLRAAALQHAPPAALVPIWTTLLFFAAVLWPFAALALWAARRHVESTGTLPQS